MLFTRRMDIVDKILEALLSAAMAREATLVRELALEEFSLALLNLEILCLARSVPDADGTRSWLARKFEICKIPDFRSVRGPIIVVQGASHEKQCGCH
jgi:hypothetical protein